MSRRYLLLSPSNAACVLEVPPGGLSEDQWDTVYCLFYEKAHPASSSMPVGSVSAFCLYEDQKCKDVYWHEELAGAGGCSFTLFPMTAHAPVAEVEQMLRSSRDVINLRIRRPIRWVSM